MVTYFSSFKQKSVKVLVSTLVGLFASTVSIIAPLGVRAAVVNPAPAAKVSFTFDDGLQSAATEAAPILAKYGYTGTDYVISGCVGMVTAPNTCHSNNDALYMSWAQVTALQNTYHWEIASHTATHPYLASKDATDGQPNVLTPAQVTTELTKSKSDLAAHGFNVTDFATPYGDYSMPVLAQIAKYYGSMRGFADTGYNTWPTSSDYIVRDQQVQAGVSVATVKGYIDTAIANNQWLVLTFHDVFPTASTDPADYQYNTADLDAIAAYIKSKNVPVVNIRDGLVSSDTNLLANPSFNSGITGGWTTDAPTNITADALTNGSYPDPVNSVKIVGTTKNVHLFSPKVAVSNATTYILKNFLNVSKIGVGEVGFYIDEYDVNGNWISGQFKSAEKSVFVEEMSFSYKPTSASVSKAALQIYTTANSGATAYVDNSQWFATTSSPVTPPPTSTNLVPNGTFDAGISGGWTTDSSAVFTADALGNGSPSNAINSVKAVASTTNKHLFSPKVSVSPSTTYSLSSYVNIKSITSGEVGYFIDEYDVNGNWISGQYKTGARTVTSGTVAFNYTPSTVNVKSASLQIIVVGNSGITAYIDDVLWQ